MAALAGEKFRGFGRDLVGVLKKGFGKADCHLRACRGRSTVFRLDRRHEKESGRGMLCVPLYSQEGEERVVEVESSARGALDCGRQNDAGGIEGVPCERSVPSCAVARRDAKGARRQISQ